jgi:hypothetical protein
VTKVPIQEGNVGAGVPAGAAQPKSAPTFSQDLHQKPQKEMKQTQSCPRTIPSRSKLN